MLHCKSGLLAGLLVMSLMLSACDSKDEKQAKYLSRGNELFEQGAYKKARLEYKNAARINPSDAEVHYRLGLVDEAEGALRQAFSQFIAAEQQDAKHLPALKKLAQYYLAARQNDEARKRIDLLLQDVPNDAEAHALNAALFLRQEDFAKTEDEAQQALKLDLANATAYTVLTGLYIAKKDQNKAEATVEAAILRNPKSLPLFLLKAIVYEKDNNLEKISEAYREIFRLYPEEARFRSDLMKVYVQAGKIDEAEALLQEGVLTVPENWNMKRLLVDFLRQQRGMEKAEAQIKSYMAAYPEKEELTFWLADLYITSKATDRAIALLQEMVEQNKADPKTKHGLNAQTSLARIHFVKGDKDVAEKLAEHVLSVDPNNRDALFIRAQMLVDQGLYQESVSVLRTIVRDDPKAQEALQLLSEVLLKQGYLDLSIDTLAQLVDSAPAFLPAKVRLAQLLSLRGDGERSLEILGHVVKFDPAYPVGWESVARIAIGMKKWDVADRAIGELRNITDQGRTADFLKGQIAAGQGHLDEAIVLYKQVIDADPQAPIAFHAIQSLAEAYSKEKKPDSLLTYLSGQVNPSPTALTILGTTYARLDQKELAIASFQKAIAAHAPTQDPYIYLAKLYMVDKKTDEAIDTLKKATLSIPSDARSLMMQGDILTAAQRYDEAIAVYDELLARDPNNDIAANNAAQIIADFKMNDAEALEKARLLSERFIRSSSPYFLDTLAWVYFRQGKLEQAQTIWERIMGYDKELPAQIHYHYGALLFETGQKKEAKPFLEKAIKGGISYEGKAEAQKMLEKVSLIQ